MEEDEIEELRNAIERSCPSSAMVPSDYTRGLLDALAMVLGEDDEMVTEILEGRY